MDRIVYTPFLNRQTGFKINTNIDVGGYKKKYNIEDIGYVKAENNSNNVEASNEEMEVEIPIKPINLKTNDKESSIKFPSKKDFVNTMTPIYERLLASKGLNPLFAKSLVAQDGLESAWGSKPSGSFNFGGIKGKGKTLKTREVINGKDVYINDSFRDFKSLEDYANYKINLLNNNRYKAFSGNINEFADRVAKGGYATDPRYANVLKRMIASARHGGILKAQEGRVLEAKNWVTDWLFNRRDLIKDNYDSVTKFSVPITGTLLYNIMKKNADLATVKIDPSKLDDDVAGQFQPFMSIMTLRSDNPDTAVHEYSHAIDSKIQAKKIDKIKDFFDGNIYEKGYIPKDEYLDDPAEIYSRLMTFRYKINADPNHKFTYDEIEELKDGKTKKKIFNMKLNDGSWTTTELDGNDRILNSEQLPDGLKYNPEESSYHRVFNIDDNINILNRYSTPFIVKILNDVASVNSDDKSNSV